jgi:hypothetical protein
MAIVAMMGAYLYLRHLRVKLIVVVRVTRISGDSR